MTCLRKRSKTMLRRGATHDEVMEYEMRQWKRSEEGEYNMQPCRDSEGYSEDRMQEIVDDAWELLKRVGDEDTRRAATSYEAEFGIPQFDGDGSVASDSGGTTRTLWDDRRSPSRQLDSFEIEVGEKWLCRKKRPGADNVRIAALKVLVHELMGHWNRNGKTIAWEPGIDPNDIAGRRKDLAEDKADDVTNRLWPRIRRRLRRDEFDAWWEEREQDCRERWTVLARRMRKCIDEFLIEEALR